MVARFDGTRRLKRRNYKVNVPGDHFELHREAPHLEVIDGGAEHEFKIPGQKLKVVQDGISVQIEHRKGKGIEVVYRKENGEVLRRISVAQVDENGRIHANHREKIESANTEYGIGQDRLRFFGEATKPKTPYGEAMKKWEDALERQRFGIVNYEQAIADIGKRKKINWKGHATGFVKGYWLSTLKNFLMHPITTISGHPQFQKISMLRRLKKEEKKYQEMLNDASDYFKIESNLNTREIKCSPSPDGAKIFMKELEQNKRRNLAQEKSLGQVEHRKAA